MQTLRQSLRAKRHAISVLNRERFAQELSSQVQKILSFQFKEKIALYLPYDGEIETKYIKKFLENKGFKIYLPILVGKSLKFAKVGKVYKKNKFGIDEPISTHILNAQQLEIIFMPLVGFDKNKNRLGMGGGFYDRTLAFKKQMQQWQSPRLYGLAFDCQRVEKLSAEIWDIKPNAIITPSACYQ